MGCSATENEITVDVINEPKRVMKWEIATEFAASLLGILIIMYAYFTIKAMHLEIHYLGYISVLIQ